MVRGHVYHLESGLCAYLSREKKVQQLIGQVSRKHCHPHALPGSFSHHKQHKDCLSSWTSSRRFCRTKKWSQQAQPAAARLEVWSTWSTARYTHTHTHTHTYTHTLSSCYSNCQTGIKTWRPGSSRVRRQACPTLEGFPWPSYTFHTSQDTSHSNPTHFAGRLGEVERLAMFDWRHCKALPRERSQNIRRPSLKIHQAIIMPLELVFMFRLGNNYILYLTSIVSSTWSSHLSPP